MSEIISQLGDYSKSNYPMLLHVNLEFLVDDIWKFSGRRCNQIYVARQTEITDLIVAAQNKYCHGLLVKEVDSYSDCRQNHLARCLHGFRRTDRGKFILTARDFKNINPALQNAAICIPPDSMPIPVSCDLLEARFVN